VLVRCFRTIPVPVRCFSPLRVGSVARFGVGDRFSVLEGVSGVFSLFYGGESGDAMGVFRRILTVWWWWVEVLRR
jgi:hypothetical protein